MNKIILTIALAIAFLISGCNNVDAGPTSSVSELEKLLIEQETSSSEPEISIVEPETPTAGSSSEADNADKAPPAKSPLPEEEDQFNVLVLNEYDGLEMTAAVLQKKAILPGSAVPVTVNITNKGDKTVTYVHGSGSFVTPQALEVRFDGLQPVRPKDHLGRATRDLLTKELKPGETLTFVLSVLAAEPVEEFDKHAVDLFGAEKLYIADLEWEDLAKRYPDLAAAKPGVYPGTVFFSYSVMEDEDDPIISEPTGYAKAELEIGVTG